MLHHLRSCLCICTCILHANRLCAGMCVGVVEHVLGCVYQCNQSMYMWLGACVSGVCVYLLMHVWQYTLESAARVAESVCVILCTFPIQLLSGVAECDWYTT